MTRDRSRPWPDLLLAAAGVAFSLWVYRSALGAYFSPDDLILLERAHGLTPRLTNAWRFVSGQLYFDLVTPLFGVDPRPYMLVNWLLHGACVALLYFWARRHVGRLGAVVAAGLFGASRLFYGVVSQVVGVGELLALAFVLAACLTLSSHSHRVRYAALPLFVLALLSKESVALLPIALLLSPAVGATVRERVQRALPLLAASFTLAVYLAFVGVHQTVLAGRAYQTGFGSNLPSALVLYAAWSLDLESLTPDYYGAATPVPWAWGIGLIALIAAAAWLTRRKTSACAVGAAWWLLGLMPVLPLLWQRYLNYMYAPSAGLALAIGGMIEALPIRGGKPAPAPAAARRAKGKPPRPARRFPILVAATWAVAALGLISYARLSATLLELKQSSRLSYADIPLDPVVRKMELARRVSTRVTTALGARHANVVFYIPEIGQENLFFSNLLRNVLDQGRGLRAVCPSVDSVAFVSQWTAQYRDFDLFAGSVDGYVDHLGRGPDAHLALAAKLRHFRLPRQAGEDLKAAELAYPADPRLHAARAALALGLRDPATAADECRATLALTPTGAVADSARAMLRRLDEGRPRD